MHHISSDSIEIRSKVLKGHIARCGFPFSERVVRAAKGRNKRRKMTRKNSICRRKSPRTARTAGRNQGFGLMTESYAMASVPSSGLRYGLGECMENTRIWMRVMHRLCTATVGIPTADGQEGRKGVDFFLLYIFFLERGKVGSHPFNLNRPTL